MTCDHISAWPKMQLPRITLVQQRPTWCGVKNAFTMPEYSNEYTFKTYLLNMALGVGSTYWNLLQ
jgi:hypothetical protein